MLLLLLRRHLTLNNIRRDRPVVPAHSRGRWRLITIGREHVFDEQPLFLRSGGGLEFGGVDFDFAVEEGPGGEGG